MKKSIIFFFVLLFPSSLFAATSIEEKISLAYTKFFANVEQKYGKEKQVEILKTIESKLNTMLAKTTLSSAKRSLLQHLYSLNFDQIEKIQDSGAKSDFIAQKEKELKYTFVLKKLSSDIDHPSYIDTLLWKWLLFRQVDSSFEFYEDGKVKKYVFDSYYGIDESNYKAFLNKSGIVLKDVNTTLYIFVEKYSIQEKIPYTRLFSDTFSTQFITEDKKYVLIDEVYYTYNFDTYSVFSDDYGFYEYNIEALGWSLWGTVFFRDGKGKFWFITNAVKTKLISEIYLDWVTDKNEFLKNVIDDKKYLSSDTDQYFKELKSVAQSITKNAVSDAQKIQIIYDWVIDNITYTKNVDLSDKKIFSWILTYKNKDGVCDGYTKLMWYMLMYGGLSHIEVIKWYVIDVPDFPQIGHAWVKIWDSYYDPTFDDPVGAVSKTQHKYFKLPEKLFYTNRYEYEDLPEYLMKLSLSERKKIVMKNISTLVAEYANTGYELLKPFEFRKKYKLSYDADISIENLKKILPYYKVASDFSFSIEGKKKYITFLQYYSLVNSSAQDIETILSQHKYDITGLYLFEWDLANGTSEYRIGYDVKF